MHLSRFLYLKLKWYCLEPSIDPPQKDFMNSFRDVLESASAENKELIVTGDFNCDFLVKSSSQETKELKEFSGTLV